MSGEGGVNSYYVTLFAFKITVAFGLRSLGGPAIQNLIATALEFSVEVVQLKEPQPSSVVVKIVRGAAQAAEHFAIPIQFFSVLRSQRSLR